MRLETERVLRQLSIFPTATLFSAILDLGFNGNDRKQ
jgi:hypothetical protein